MENFTKHLPESLVAKYRIHYTYVVEDKYIIFYNLDEGYGVFDYDVFKIGSELPRHLIISPALHLKGIEYHSAYDFFACTKTYKPELEKEFYFYKTDGKLFKHFPKNIFIDFRQSEAITIRLRRITKRFRVIEKQGILDSNLDLLIAPIYDEIFKISDDLYKIKIKRSWGIIDSARNILLPIEYKAIFNVNLDKTVIVKKKDGKCFLFNILENKIYDLPYDRIYPHVFNNNSSIFRHKSLVNAVKIAPKIEYAIMKYSGKYGIVDNFGQELIPNIYDYIDYFSSHKYFKVAIGKINFSGDEETDDLEFTGVKWGVINSENKIVVPIIYDWIEELKSEYLDVSNLWKVNKNGTVFFNINDKYEWDSYGGKYGVINGDNKIIIPVLYDSIFIDPARGIIGELKSDGTSIYDGFTSLGEMLPPRKESYY